MNKKIKINEILILYFVVIGIISISSVSLLTYYQSRKAILDRSFEQLTAIRNLKKKKIESFFSDRLHDMQLLSESTDILYVINQLRHDDTIGLSTESYIYKYIFGSDYYSNIVFGDEEHTLSQSANHIQKMQDDGRPENEYLTNSVLSDSLRGGFLADYSRDHPDSLYVSAFARVNGLQGYRSGYILLTIPQEMINQIMMESTTSIGFGESGETYLVGYDYVMRSASRFMPNSVLQIKVETKAARDAFLMGEGTIITKDYRGITVLSSFCRLNIPGLDWILLSEIDFKEVIKPVYHLRNTLLFLSIVLIIVVFGIGWFLSITIASPINKIKEAALKISAGDFPSVEMKSQTEEINELMQTFNMMSVQLKENREQLKAAQVKQLSAMFDGQEDERKRLSYELHDGLGQSLVAIKLRLELLGKHSTGIEQETLNELNQSVTLAIQEVRQMAFNLMPAILSEFGLVSALENVCNNLRKQTGKSIVFEKDGVFDRINDKQKNYIFRIAQEVLVNAIKHADASLISLQLIEFPDFYTIIAEDNGKGFDYNPQVAFNGNGLYSILDRTEILNGKCIIQSEPDKGTIIRIKIPK